MSDATNPPAPPPKPQGPQDASEAATNLLRSLPRVKIPESGQFAFGYYKGGKPVYIPMSLDRSMAMGTLQGIAEGRVTQGDRSLLGGINVAFIRPLEEAIKEASKGDPIQAESGALLKSGTHNPDISENQRLLNTTLNAIDWAASFGLFNDQALNVKRGKFEGIGFTAKERGGR